MTDAYGSAYILITEYIPTIFIYLLVGCTLLGIMVKALRNDGSV